MATYFRLLDVGRQFFDSNGNPLSGGKVYTYEAGTTTDKTTYQDDSGSSSNTNPIVLDSTGTIPYEVWGTTGAYKLKLENSVGSTIWTRDDIAGINDTAAAGSSEWIASGMTPTYISETSFSVAGDQTSTLQPGRRIKTVNTGGTAYSTIYTSVFGAVTTVTVINDSTTLDSGLSSVSYGILSFANQSFPGYMAHSLLKNTFSASASSIFTCDTTRYSAFMIRFLDVTPATDGVDLRITIGTGGAFDAGTNYRWARNDTGNGGANTVTSGTIGAFAIGALAVSNQAQRKINGTLFLTSLADYPRFNWDWSYGSTTETMIRSVGAGHDNIAAARDQIKFAFSSGNIASGSMTLYGLPI